MPNQQSKTDGLAAVALDPVVRKRVSNLAREALQTDGAHHKQWFLAMILKEVDAPAHYDCEQWGVDMGIAP